MSIFLNNCSLFNGTLIENCTLVYTNTSNSTKTTLTVVTSKGFLKIEQILLMFFFFALAAVIYSCCLSKTRYYFKKKLQYGIPSKTLLGWEKKTKPGYILAIEIETERSLNIRSESVILHNKMDYSHIGLKSIKNRKKNNFIKEAYRSFKRQAKESLRDCIEKFKSGSLNPSVMLQYYDVVKEYEEAKYGVNARLKLQNVQVRDKTFSGTTHHHLHND